MAESIVNVTEGSGKKLHTFNRTIGANSVEDEVTLNGEQYLASYTAVIGAPSSTATANSHLAQIMAGASLKVRIRRIEVWQFALATTAAYMDTRIYRLTTAGTGGTAATPAPLDTTDAASGATSQGLPTAKGTEGTNILAAPVYMVQTITASPAFPTPLVVWDFDRPRSKPLIIAAGTTNGIAIKNITAIAAASVIVNIWFDESNF
jgi:hypothetical protein